MSKFKVGDKVRLVGNDARSVNRVGEVGTVTLILGDDASVECGAESVCNWSRLADLELIPTNTLQVGETYTSENGSEWECIFIRDGKAWLVGVYSGGAEGSAYAFDIDGTASWASCAGDDGYNIKWGPKRETVTKYIDYVAGEFYNGNLMVSGQSLSVTFDLINGTPDWTTVKVTPCD